MQPKLLLFDIGNTSVKLGFANRDRVLASYSLPTDTGQTADSFGLTLLSVLRHAGVDANALTACVASSVVPVFDPLLREALTRYVGKPLYYAPGDLAIPLRNLYRPPAEVGADRLVSAFAARRIYPDAPSLIVVDFGTAVTFDCIRAEEYLGGLIFPGPLTAINALSRETAKLPRVNLVINTTEFVPGRDTSTSIRHGLVFGFVCVVEGLAARLARDLPDPCPILGTGGFAPAIARLSNVFDRVLPNLLLDGLRRLYYDGRES
ncbi:MAG: type III pantothenate kinase [Desulfovibrio sp.]|jgi:type III pantothenate kinase|nr:type III pantothenate kinase [Desulfovibrio sp.]